MTLIRELIDIPEHAQRCDFVLRLTEGVGQAERTLGQYVVTPELRRCFDDALAFIRSALTGLRGEFTFLEIDRDTLVRDANGGLRWWTFAGLRANAGLGVILEAKLGHRPRADNLALSFDDGVSGDLVAEAVVGLRETDPLALIAEAVAPAERFIKFQRFVPPAQLNRAWVQRTFDANAMRLGLRRFAGAVASEQQVL